MTDIDGGLEFGFVPKHVVSDLKDIGNWKSRAVAIDTLEKALKNVTHKGQLYRNLDELCSFLTQLVADPNFKIAVSSTQIIATLASLLGRDLEPHLRSMVPSLTEKFTDSKVLVRNAVLKLILKLMEKVSVRSVCQILLGCTGHVSWRAREELLNCLIMGLLHFNKDAGDPATIFKAFTDALSDSKERVRVVALEGLAVMRSRFGVSELDNLLARGGVTPTVRQQVENRLRNTTLPALNSEGLVQHTVDLPDDTQDTLGRPWYASNTNSRPGSIMQAGKLPFDVPAALGPRPRTRAVPSSQEPAPAGTTTSIFQSSSLPAGLVTASSNLPGVATPTGATPLWSPAAPANIKPPPPPFVSTQLGQLILGQKSSDPNSGSVRNSRDTAMSGASWPRLNLAEDSIEAAGMPSNSRPSAPAFGARPELKREPSDGMFTASGATAVLRRSLPTGSAPVSMQTEDTMQKRGNTNDVSAPLPTPLASVRRSGANALLSPAGDIAGSLRQNDLQREPSEAALQPNPVGTRRSMPSNSSTTSPPQAGIDASTGLIRPDIQDLQREASEAAVQPSSVGSRRPAPANSTAASLQQPKPQQARSDAHTGTQLLETPGYLPAATFKAMFRRPEFEQSSISPPSPPLAAAAPASTSLQAPTTPRTKEVEVPTSSHNPGISLWLNQQDLQQEGPGHREETLSPSKTEVLANLKRRQIEKRANSSQLSSRPDSLDSPMHGDKSNDADAPSTSHLQPKSPFASSHSNLLSPVQPNRTALPTSASLPSPVYSVSSAPIPVTMDALAVIPRSNSQTLQRPPSAQRVPRNSRPSSNGTVASPGTAPRAVSPGMGMSATVPNTPLRTRLADMTSPARSLPATPSAGTPTKSGMLNPAGPTELAHADLIPVESPEKAVRTVIADLSKANSTSHKELEWAAQFEALNDARRLVAHHPDVVRSCLHELVKAAVPAVEQLRSYTSKNAITLVQEMFGTLGRALDKELEEIVPVLLKIAGQVSNAGRENFLAIEADRALSDMCSNCSEARCVTALLACSSHKSMHVRVKVASHLDEITDMPSSKSVLLNNWSLLDKLFKAAAGFLEEGALETRTYGKRIIWNIKQLVANRSDFDRLVAQIQSDSCQKKVLDVVETSNGPPPPPTRQRIAGRSSNSAGSFSPASPTMSPSSTERFVSVPGSPANGYGPRGVSVTAPAGTSVSGPPDRSRPPRIQAFEDGSPQAPRSRFQRNGSGGMTSPGRQAPAGRQSPGRQSPGRISRGPSTNGAAEPFNSASADTVTKVLQSFQSKNHQERTDALRTLDEILPSLTKAPDNMLLPLLEGLTGRLGDGNVKIIAQTLDLLARVFPLLRERVGPALNTMVPAIAAGLASSNSKVQASAIIATNALVDSIDATLLVQNFSHCLVNGKQQSKPFLVEKLKALLPELYRSKPQLVTKYAVPAAFALVNDSKTQDMKAACTQLLTALLQLMGDDLFGCTNSLSQPLKQRVLDAILSLRGM